MTDIPHAMKRLAKLARKVAEKERMVGRLRQATQLDNDAEALEILADDEWDFLHQYSVDGGFLRRTN